MQTEAFLRELDTQIEQVAQESKEFWDPESSMKEATRSIAAVEKDAQVRAATRADLMARGLEMVAETLEIPKETVLNRSTALEGAIGFLNTRNRKKREKLYEKRLRENPGAIRVISEGDSWFQYPIYVKDIIDWLIEDKNYAVYSLGAGGDWLANIFEQREYIKVLERTDHPQVFLISGGGNDLLQDFRITKLLHTHAEVNSDDPKDYVKEEFSHLIKLFEYLYTMLYRELEERFPQLQIISHGYGYAYPSDRRGPGLLPALIHAVSGNGQWLVQPMRQIGITDGDLQFGIVKVLIDAFNENQETLSQRFPNVHYLDLRRFPKTASDWHDEIHPKSEVFKSMAETYKATINTLLFGAP